MALIELVDIELHYGDTVLADKVCLTLQPKERVCLIGRNGAGKTSLLKIISGEMEADAGERRARRDLRVARLGQEADVDHAGDIYDVVAQGLGEEGQLLAEYHDLSHSLTHSASESDLKRLERLQQKLDSSGAWNLSPRIEEVLSRMLLDGEQSYRSLSGGMRRRVMLARALVTRPDILLLDEPTNHLDIEAIQWLEEFLLEFSGSLVFITHDRAFLQKLATRIVELDRGHLHSWDCDYRTYLQRREAQLQSEATQNAEFDKKLAQEEQWIRQGVQARRTRNEGRVRALKAMRDERRSRREQSGKASLRVESGERSGKLVVEAEGVDYAWGEQVILKDLSATIMRGDKIGIIGPNGSGKTTLLRILLGELKPQAGSVRLGTKLEIAYFDQHRGALDEDKSVIDVVAEGREQITINGGSKHVMGYLKDFLFDPGRVRQPVRALSGGERNRLLLAKLFTKPANLLVLDEPTNDLDLETLELLEELLVEFNGTLLLISHDRSFIDNVVTSTLVLEGDGRVGEYVGGYEDMLRQRRAIPATEVVVKPQAAMPVAHGPVKKPGNKERRELNTLPGKIEKLEREQKMLHQSMADPIFYQQGAEKVSNVQQRLAKVDAALAEAYARWEVLEALFSG